jgi:ferritin-like metal-binding protein YciE
MPVSTLEELYVHQLIEMYNGETHILTALPKMAKLAPTTLLQQAFDHHYDETVVHVDRLEQILASYDVHERPGQNPALFAIIEQGQHLTTMIDKGLTLEMALIAAAQHVEHYEIAAYGTLHMLAIQLGDEFAAGLLEQTLDEEQATDLLLSQLAVQDIQAQQELVSSPSAEYIRPL